MSQNTFTTLLQEAQVCYSQGQYQACVALLNDCLLFAPNLSHLLSNKALANYHLERGVQAITDLRSSIQADHLNYIAYFNLFSLSWVSGQQQSAFQNLCFSLSSILTFRSRELKELSNMQRALHYCFNNKEVILLKGMLHLQQRDHQKALKMLNEILVLEPSTVIRGEVMAIIARIQRSLGKEVTDRSIKYIGGTPYRLRTTLTPPLPDNYNNTINSMVAEFNQIYSQLLKPTQQSKMLSMNCSRSFNNSLMQHSLSSIKEDRANCLTAYNSILPNESECQLSDERSLIRNSFTILMERESNNWLDRSSSHSIIPEESSSLAQNWSSSVASEKPISSLDKPLSVTFTLSYAKICNSSHKMNNLYLVLEYCTKENNLYRSALTDYNQGLYTWEEQTTPFKLAPFTSKLGIKLYHKDFYSFADQLIGQGELAVGQLGRSMVPIILQDQMRGQLVLGINLNE